MLDTVKRAVPAPDRGTMAGGGGRRYVLFINDTSRNGGPGRTILDITKFLDPSRIHRTILVPREGIVSRLLADNHAADRIMIEPDLIENMFEPFSRPIERNDFDANVALKAVRAGGNVLRALRGIVRLVRHVRRDKFDLVFCNGTAANFVGGILGMIAGVPVIWHVLYPGVPPVANVFHRRLSESRNVRSIICVSRATEGQFARCREKIRAVHDALDIAEFDASAAEPRLRAELGLRPGTVIFGSHGRILPRKGFMELVRAARTVFDNLGPEDRKRCCFVVLGDTPQDIAPDHLEECRALVRQLGLTDFVRFIGFRADVRPYVADFDVAVVPSVYEDPLPRAVMESMAMGKPVAAFAMGGIGEMINDQVEGLLACGRPPDTAGLAQACLRYFHDPDLRRAHGAAARRRIEQEFDARKHAEKLQEEMLRVIESVE